MIKFKHKGDFSKTIKFMEKVKGVVHMSELDKYGKEGVAALMSATPQDTGETANSWYYKIERTGDSASINFYNSNRVDGVPIAIILQYGHATRNGGYVEGIDYINPALKPIFDKIANEAWEEVTRA